MLTVWIVLQCLPRLVTKLILFTEKQLCLYIRLQHMEYYLFLKKNHIDFMDNDMLEQLHSLFVAFCYILSNYILWLCVLWLLYAMILTWNSIMLALYWGNQYIIIILSPLILNFCQCSESSCLSFAIALTLILFLFICFNMCFWIIFQLPEIFPLTDDSCFVQSFNALLHPISNVSTLSRSQLWENTLKCNFPLNIKYCD